MELTEERDHPDGAEHPAEGATLEQAHAELYGQGDAREQGLCAGAGEPQGEGFASAAAPGSEGGSDVGVDEPVAGNASASGDGDGSEVAVTEAGKGSAAFEGSVGLGVDIVEIDRMAGILERNPSFATRVFSEAECAYCEGKSKPATHYALRFAAKEAVVKALGTGFSQGIGVRDVEVVRTKRGRPTVVLTGRAKEVAEEQGVRDISISLSYTHTEAVACAMAITESSIRATEKRKDPMEELTRQFKEVRGMLDDL